MSRLSLHFLGPPRVQLDGAPLKLQYRKNLALIAYLSITGESHTREALITLLWPDLEPRRARANLRRNLSMLRTALGGEWLVVGRESIGLEPSADLWSDLDQFRAPLGTWREHGHSDSNTCLECLGALAQAVKLYRGDFMAGFGLRDSIDFDEWQVLQTEKLRQELAWALERLVRAHSGRGEFEQAISYAQRWLTLDPLQEPVHRHLMRLYAWSGQRSAALRQYRQCVQVLEQDLGLPPSDGTTRLYERVRAEGSHPTEPGVSPSSPTHVSPISLHLPGFLSDEVKPTRVEETVFVAREHQLERLSGFLELALAGSGHVVFVTGGPGRGKTALVREFARRAMQAQPDLLVASGSCNAYSGVVDAYLPFRQALAMLTGDVEARWAAGTVSHEHARRLWAAVPLVVQALLAHGPSLIEGLLPGTALLARARAAGQDSDEWLAQLMVLTDQGQMLMGDMKQSQLFEGYADTLCAIAAAQPLLLMLDDFQWADTSSISLLYHLGRRLADVGCRALIVGAYRPEEVILGRSGERHPLAKTLAEFKRHFGDVEIDLGRVDERESRRFLNAYLDSQPNRLGAAFREALFRHTRGHPLFTIELLRTMQERGDLIRDSEGCWRAVVSLDSVTLPPRVGAVIEERVSRLDKELRDTLAVSSVEGEEFTAQVVARVQGVSERQILGALSQELDRRHRLVRENEELRIDGNQLSRYRFSHALVQQYLYGNLSTGERRLLHREIGAALEGLYTGRTEEIAVQLAHHFAEGSETTKAIEYLLIAGDQARLAFANLEAIEHYKRALEFLKIEGEYERAARTLMKLGLTYHSALQFHEARQAYDEGFLLSRQAEKAMRNAVVPPPPAPHPLRLPWHDPETVDPTRTHFPYDFVVIASLFSGLVRLSPEMEVLPDVAESWEMSEDGRVYLFHLRDDARWSDGRPVTAADFEYALKRTLDPVTGSPVASFMYVIKGGQAFHQGRRENLGVHAVDPRTLVVELERPTGYFLNLLTHPNWHAVPRHVVEVKGEAWTDVEHIVTNGPFRLENWHRGESLVLMRNPSYHRRFVGNVQHVELLLSTSVGFTIRKDVCLEAYAADDLDVVDFMSALNIDFPGQQYQGERFSVPAQIASFVAFDLSQPPFDNRGIRRAFALATDRERLADVVLEGSHFPATGGLVPPGVPGHVPGIALPYDPGRGRQLLAEAGFPGGRDFPSVRMISIEGYESVCESLQTQWRKNLGIGISLEIVDYDTFIESIFAGKVPPIVFAPWPADYPDPHNFLRDVLQVVPVHWGNQSYWALVEEATCTLDQRERMKLYARAEKILVEEAPVVPLLYLRMNLLVKPWVKYPAATGGYGFWQDVIIEPH